MKILLVDDHAPLRGMLRRLIEDTTPHRVVAEAEDGVGVVELVERYDPDVVLMDGRMPRADGVEATRAIKEVYPEVDVIALSADDVIGAQMVEAGAKLFVNKAGPASSIVSSLNGL